MSTPLLPWQVYDGGTYWAAWGKTGWSAIMIIQTRRKTAHVARVNPRNGKVTTRNAKVRLDELIKRDPKKKGEDRPAEAPDAIFGKERQRKAEEKIKNQMVEEAPVLEQTPERSKPLPKGWLEKTWIRFRVESCGYTKTRAKKEWAEESGTDW